MNTHLTAVNQFIDRWPDSPDDTRRMFRALTDHMAARPGVKLEFIERPGLTASLRAGHPGGRARKFFVMIDVIEDDPRWLSVCFFDDVITDPEERGDMVPEGLEGADARCFDLAAFDEDDLAYITARLDEAWKRAEGR